MIYGIIVLGLICIWLSVLLLRVWKRVKDKEKALRTEKEFTETVMKNVNASIVLIDTDFMVVQTNYYTLTQTKDSSSPKRVGELLKCRNGLDAGFCGGHLDCADCPVRKAINRAFAKEENFKDLEAPMTLYIDDNGHTSDFELMVSGAHLKWKEKAYLLLTLYDVTPLKRLQRELAAAKERAEQADKLKTAFLANMSHEIRTPLHAIVGFSELLSTSEGEEKNKYLAIINHNNELLLQLINDILDVSKIEAGTLDFKYSDVDINSLLTDLCEFFRRKKKEGLPVEISCSLPLDPCVVYTEKRRLTQVFSNLMSNALKFTSQGYIRVGYEWRDTEIYFYVQDSGTGIPLEEQGKLFRRFAKLNRLKPGSGLGLFICHTIIEKLGGRMGVESSPGNGSLFWFVVPANKAVGNTCEEGTLLI